jgi:hypothetical protein
VHRLLRDKKRLLLAAGFFCACLFCLAQDDAASADPKRPFLAPSINLIAVPSHTAKAINLSWQTGTPAGAIMERWTDGTSPVSLGAARNSAYVDPSIAPNTIYYYALAAAAGGGLLSNVMPAVYSDLTKPFNCPPQVPVAENRLGVDRTERFVGANGQTTSFTIQVPARNGVQISLAACGSRPGCDDYTNLTKAIAKIGAAKTGTIRFAAGDFYLKPGAAPYNILLINVHDVTLAGAGYAPSTGIPSTHIYFDRGNSGKALGLAVAVTKRVLVRNIAFDWDYPNAIPGTISTQDPSHQRLNVRNPSYYIPDPNNPPTIGALVGYHLANRTYDLEAGARLDIPGKFNPNFRTDGLYYYLLDGNYFPAGAGAIGYVPSSIGIQVGPAAFNTSFEHVALYGGGGPGLIYAAQGRGLRLSNFTLTRKPDSLLAPGEQPRYVALFGDSDSNSNQGDILIENSEIGFVDDDFFYMRGSVVSLQTLTSTSSFSVTAPGMSVTHARSPTDFLLFLDPSTMAPISSTMPLATWTQTFSGGKWTWTATFPPLSALERYVGRPAAQLPLVNMPYWSSPNFIIRNSCFHDSHGRVFANTQNGLIENNVFGNNYYGPLVLFSDPSWLKEGPGPSNVIVRGNKIIGSGYGLTDLSWLGKSAGYGESQGDSAPIYVSGISSTGFVPTGYPWRNIVVSNNFISSTPGEGITVMGVGSAQVSGNTIVDANTVPYTADFATSYCGARSRGYNAIGAYQPWCIPKIAARGAIMLGWDKAITASGNIYLGTSKGLFVDPSVVAGH